MRLSTKLKLIGIATLLAFAIGYVLSRYRRIIKKQWDQARQKRELNRELAQVLGEKARIEEELRQMEGEE